MRLRIALPLLLLAAGCAEVPTSPDGALLDQQAAGRSRSANARAGLPRQSVETQALPSTPPSPALQQAADLETLAAQQIADEPPKSLWPRITRGFSMAPLDNDLVREWENWYASRPDYVARMIDRSSHFLFHIVEQVEKRNMPLEIALLPMIESAYNPVAYSKSHASGIWQFIPSTGKDFGLRQNWWYDGRRDVIAATEAALDYLEKLHGMFGDWQLALASYNWGEGAVSRAIERNRAKGLPTDYESLTLPPETRGYVPKLIAVKNIILDPAKYGLQIADIPNEPYFGTVTVRRHMDMKLAAKLAEMPLDEFRFLNPGHNKPVIKAGEAERIILPTKKIALFRANLAHHGEPLVSWKAVTLRRGEKAERVAAEHGMTLAELKRASGVQNQKKLYPGQPLLVQVKGGVEHPDFPDLPVTPVSLSKALQAAKAAARTRHYVQIKGVRGKPGVRKVVQKPVVVKGRKRPVHPVRTGRVQRTKAVPAKPATRKARAPTQREKLASR